MSPVNSKFNRTQNKKLFLTLFIVIVAPRPVNKNVSTGAGIRAKCGAEPRAFTNYWRTIKPLVRLLSLYTDPESHNAERYRHTDGPTEYMMMSIADQTVQQYDRLKSIISKC